MKVINGKRSQRGITLIGFLIVLVVAGFFAYMGMILGPTYTEYYGVMKAMNFVAAQSTPGDTNFDEMKKSLDKQFNVGYVDTVDSSQAKLIRDKGGNSLNMDYQVEKPFIYNVFFTVKFSYTVPLGSKTAGD
jgi:Tfp pilus assembly major pilin PilA